MSGAEPQELRAALLQLRGLACQRGDRILWRGLDARVDAGGALLVRGPNGTGKSSLLRIIAGLLPPLTGQIERSVAIGLVDEGHALDRDVPLHAALTFWARIDGVATSAIAPALARLGIAHLSDVPVRHFSTGQRRRAALARLVMGDNPLWLLDEPANGLDVDGVALLEQLVAAHRQSGGAVILASHQALAIADAATIDLSDHRP